MSVLVAAASKHGSTLEIAETIGAGLRTRGLPCDVLELRDGHDVPDPAQYEAFVVGSAVYMGRWLPPARNFLSANRALLLTHPVWLFSSGPVDVPPKPRAPADEAIAAMSIETGAREHRVFDGRLERQRLGRMERIVVATIRAEDGDARNFPAIREWSGQIATQLER